ncbi:hypothetical protein [Streptosporangium roseum]|uniref:hypothetical protein n=1 Tax=Streptosporangium roseum TaxID=2001 RepID=UPI003316AD2A
MLPHTPDQAERAGNLLLQDLGLPSWQATRLVDIPVADLLAGQGGVARRTAAPLSAVPPFQIVADGELVAADPVTATGTRGADGVQILMGTTRDEAAAFFAADEQVEALGRWQPVRRMPLHRTAVPSRNGGRVARCAHARRRPAARSRQPGTPFMDRLRAPCRSAARPRRSAGSGSR